MKKQTRRLVILLALLVGAVVFTFRIYAVSCNHKYKSWEDAQMMCRICSTLQNINNSGSCAVHEEGSGFYPIYCDCMPSYRLTLGSVAPTTGLIQYWSGICENGYLSTGTLVSDTFGIAILSRI